MDFGRGLLNDSLQAKSHNQKLEFRCQLLNVLNDKELPLETQYQGSKSENEFREEGDDDEVKISSAQPSNLDFAFHESLFDQPVIQANLRSSLAPLFLLNRQILI